MLIFDIFVAQNNLLVWDDNVVCSLQHWIHTSWYYATRAVLYNSSCAITLPRKLHAFHTQVSATPTRRATRNPAALNSVTKYVSHNSKTWHVILMFYTMLVVQNMKITWRISLVAWNYWHKRHGESTSPWSCCLRRNQLQEDKPDDKPRTVMVLSGIFSWPLNLRPVV